MKINQLKLTLYSGITLIILGLILNMISLSIIDNENDIFEIIGEIVMCVGFFIAGFTISSYFDYEK